MNIFPPIFFLLALWICAFNRDYMVLGEDSGELSTSATICLNCTVCEQPCNPLPPPSPLSGYPSYRAPPPPPASPSGYPSYGTPPPPSLPGYGYGAAPPPPRRPVQANCPPATPVQCCQYPSNNIPYPYEYEPFGDHSPTLYLPLSTYSIVTLLLSFVVLF